MWTLTAFWLVFALPLVALAAPLDKAANKKIDEAINVHYLATEFKKALGILEGTIEACGEKCSSEVLGRAWMYIGIVKGAGLQNQKGAEEAFATALSTDPNVKLDKDLATDELVALFEEVGGDASKSAAPPVTEVATPPGVSSGEAMTCTPEVSEMETSRPIPVSCRSSKPATKAVLFYKEFGAPSYTEVTLSLSGSEWRGTVPCTATSLQGELRWFVSASGAGGPVDAYGSEGEPNVIQVVASTSEPPPSFPGQPAPARCADAAECPEEMRGTPSCPDVAVPSERGDKTWGAGCKKHKECEEGLYCLSGSCESPPSCETGADCDSKICEDFLCKILEDEDADGGGDSGDKDAPTNFIGVAFGADLSSISGEYVCNLAPQSNASGVPVPVAEPSTFRCFVGEKQYISHPYANNVDSGAIASSVVPGTLRAYLTYEHIFVGQIGIEGQVGLGFLGSPNTGIVDLIHGAVFGKYWFMGTGEGFKLYGALGGGIGQVDANAAVAVAEYGDNGALGPDPNSVANERSTYWDTYCPANDPAPCTITPVQAYKSLGQSFIGAGVGGLVNLGGVGIDIRLLGKFMLPATGVVLQPTAGVVYGF